MTETQTEIDKLEEGFAPVYVWCVDKVGNIGEAAGSGILVDFTNPVFSNLTPLDGSWHNHSDIECSAEIWDGEGAGVDGSSIEYSISSEGMANFAVWIPAWMSTNDNRMVPSISYNFQEGEDNYIKWRAKDMADNYLVESLPVNIKIDTAPIEFGEVITPVDYWFGEKEITTKIMVSDPGIGVDINSLQARISTSGPSGFGEWMTIEKEDIADSGPGEYEITATFTYSEGVGNYIMFRGTDLVGNPLAMSDKINLKVDVSKVYFTDFTPEEDTASDELEVECFISMMDDGAGVDGTTIEYSISTEGTDEKEFGPWKRPLSVVAGNPTQVLIQVEFEWGMNNYIRWRADDKIGTGVNTSRPYRIWTNSEPEAVISSPYPGEKYGTEQEIFFDGSGSEDMDGDNLTFFWTSNIAENRTLGHMSSFRVKLAPGNHTITMFVSDGNGFNVSKKVKIDVGKESGERGGGGGGKEEGNLLATEGKSNLWLYFIIIAVVLVSVVVVVMLIVIRRKKKHKKDTASQLQPELSPYAAPQPHPYPQGGYHPEMQQGYVQQDFHGTDPVTGQRLPQLNQGFPGNTPYPALPPGPQPGTGDQDHFGMTPETAYSLPQFGVDGSQNLNLMALPPGPDPFPATVSPELGGNHAPPPLEGFEAAPIPEPTAAPLPADQWALPGEIAALPGLPLTEPPTMPPGEQPSYPENAATGTETSEITMQCHSCSINYTTTVNQLPAVVTCPHCQAQGMIENI